MSTDLATWLLAQLEADAELAQSLLKPYAWGYSAFYEASPKELDHIARHDPEHVLVDIAAKRRIVKEHQPVGSDLYPEQGSLWCGTCSPAKFGPCQTLRLLALPYADRPGYDPAWAPEEES